MPGLSRMKIVRGAPIGRGAVEAGNFLPARAEELHLSQTISTPCFNGENLKRAYLCHATAPEVNRE